GIPPERERFAVMPVLTRDTRTFVTDGKRHGRETHRHAIPDIVVHPFELRRFGEVARVVVSNGEFHCLAGLKACTTSGRASMRSERAPVRREQLLRAGPPRKLR